jgi:hypothetical protein
VAGPRSFGGPVFVERDVIVNRGGGLGPVGSFAVPFVGGLVGAAVGNALTSPRPTPVVVGAVPAPGYVPAQPVPVPAPIAQAAPGDLVPTEVERLKSWNGNTRVEAAMVLGKLGDPRAVPHLVHTLRDDHKDEVREYSAWALGMIGDPQGRAYLEVASTNDSKRKVRDAALKALARMDQVAAMPTPPPSPAVAAPAAPTWAARTTPAPSATNSGGGRSYTPPPPPEPVLPSPPSP